MKSLVQHINEKLVIFPSQVNEKLVIFPSQVDEKLVINKNFKAPETNDKLVMDIINKHFDGYMNINYEMMFKSSIKASLETSLDINGIEKKFNKMSEFNELNDKMSKYSITYRYVYDPKNSLPAYESLRKDIEAFLKDIDNNGIDLEEMWYDEEQNYSVQYYECSKFVLLWIGSDNFGYVYISMN